MEAPMVFALAVLFAFCVSTVSTQCGKSNLKVNFGQRKTFVSPGTGGACKYKVRVPRGLHIKLTFNELRSGSGFTVYDATARPFKWSAGKLLSEPSGSQPEIFETHMIGVKPGSSPASFFYEAVIPKNGNIGFKAQASKKRKVIRSPGFPRVKLPTGMRSHWDIRAKAGQHIVIDFLGLNMAHDSGYVEVSDSEQLLGRHSGKLSTLGPIKHYAVTGRLRVYLHTDTANSKGFKATYQALKVNTTTVSVGTESPTGLRCHQRNRVMSQGATLLDDYSSTSCRQSDVCGRLLVKGTSTQFGGAQPITSETLNCIPNSMCDGSACDTMPPTSGVTVSSCELSCCSSDFCNKSPDGPSIPPSPTPDTRLLCYGESEIKIGEGPALAMAGGDVCNSGTICGLFVFQGSGRQWPGVGPVDAASGYVAQCVSESQCNEEGCKALRDLSHINITSCQASCCKTKLCNDPKTRSTSLTPSLEAKRQPGKLRCYNILVSEANGVRVINQKKTTDCNDNSVCMLLSVTTTMSEPEFSSSRVSGKAIFGSCYPADQQATAKCERMLSDLNADPMAARRDTQITDCSLSFCDDNLCNDHEGPPLPTHVPTATLAEPTKPLQCYAKRKIISSFEMPKRDFESVVTCPVASSCQVSEADVRISSSYLSTEMKVISGNCIPTAMCEVSNCDLLDDLVPKNVLGMKVDVIGCRASCCAEDLCNRERAATTSQVPPSLSTTLLTASDEIKCYDILQVESMGRVLPGAKKEKKECSPGSQCLRVRATATHSAFPSIKMTTIYGSCVPSVACSSADCSSFPSIMRDVTIEGCDSSCCDTDLCNG